MNIFLNKHPENWTTEIVPTQLKKADWKCQICKVPRGAKIVQDENQQWLEVDPIIEKWAQNTKAPIRKMKLYIQPLNFLRWDTRPQNLKVMCDKCRGDHSRKYYAKLSTYSLGQNFESLLAALKSENGAFLFNFGITTANAAQQSILTLESIYNRRHVKGYDSEYDKSILAEIKHRKESLKNLISALTLIASEELEIPNFDQLWSENIIRLNRQIGVTDDL